MEEENGGGGEMWVFFSKGAPTDTSWFGAGLCFGATVPFAELFDLEPDALDEFVAGGPFEER